MVHKLLNHSSLFKFTNLSVLTTHFTRSQL